MLGVGSFHFLIAVGLGAEKGMRLGVGVFFKDMGEGAETVAACGTDKGWGEVKDFIFVVFEDGRVGDHGGINKIR